MEINKFNKYELVYLTFAFDSLLKIGVGGYKLHIGIVAILLLIIVDVITSLEITMLKSFIRKNWSLLPFAVYLFINITMNHDYPGILITLTYYLLGITVFYFIFMKEKYISTEAVVSFQWILIVTGLFQFVLFKLFGYQIAFIEAEHYNTFASFATRLRGFFVEPNWYSIVISFNILLLVMQLKNELFKYKWLIALTLLVVFFNASYTFLGVIVLGIFLKFFFDLPKISKKRVMFFLTIALLLTVAFVFRVAMKTDSGQNEKKISSYVNYGSRLRPVINTIFFMDEQTVEKQLFGFGIGSWPYVGLEENQLGYIGMRNEYVIKPAQRDSAEFQVFLLELGYIGLILFVFDYIYNYWRYRQLNFIYSLASAFILASFLVYPIFKFLMYLIPYYLIRAKALKGK